MDFEHSRKNIVLPYIYGSCSVNEKEQLLNSDEINTETIFNLYEKYGIEQIIKNDLKNIEEQLKADFDKISTMQINVLCL